MHSKGDLVNFDDEDIVPLPKRLQYLSDEKFVNGYLFFFPFDAGSYLLNQIFSDKFLDNLEELAKRMDLKGEKNKVSAFSLVGKV